MFYFNSAWILGLAFLEASKKVHVKMEKYISKYHKKDLLLDVCCFVRLKLQYFLRDTTATHGELTCGLNFLPRSRR